MKHKLLLNVLFVIALGLAISVFAASSFTPNYNLEKPAAGDTGWADALNSNADEIDEQMFVNQNTIQDHINNAVGAHASTAISTVPGGIVCFESITVQDFLECLDLNLGVLTTGAVVTINTAQDITGQKTFTALTLLDGGFTSGGPNTMSALSTGVLHADSNGLISSSLVVNADVDAAAGITYGKLSLTDSILDADINSAAAIAYSKLDLTGGIVNSDVSSSAAIDYSKLDLTGDIVNADISASAAIARSKVASGTAHRLLVNDSSGLLAEAPALTDGQLLVGVTGAASAAKTLQGTANQVTVTNNAGDITLSTPQSIATTSDVQFGSVMAGSGSKSASAVLEAASTTAGFLPPRMTETQRDAIASPASGLVIYNTDSNGLNVYNGSAWGSVGGGTFVSTFTGTTLTTTNDSVQKWRYTGGSAQVLASIDHSLLPDGGTLYVTGSDDTNTLLMPEGLADVYQNGDKTLYNRSSIQYLKDGTDLIQVGM